MKLFVILDFKILMFLMYNKKMKKYIIKNNLKIYLELDYNQNHNKIIYIMT